MRKHIERKPGLRVLVVGGSGSIGLYVADVARALGADALYCDISRKRIEMAKACGVGIHRGLPGPELGLFDLSVDASATPKLLRQALLLLEPEGHCESVGIYFEDVSLPMLEMYMRSVRFRIGRGNARAAMPMVIGLKARDCIRPEHMFTRSTFGTMLRWHSSTRPNRCSHVKR